MQSLKFQPEKTVSESDDSTEKEYITAQSAKLNISGRYKNIVSLINKLQQRPQRVWIDLLNIKKINDASAQLGCKFTITIYLMPDRERNCRD